ncbi:Tat pathway signal sequence domain protein [Gleimia coleocanis DSM 15436]|uniref:Tat pathway signal sequence domain protein n=1 Tax=Gleimia coleocanis DSM 15436 TaxID=525245 RepID=C0W201_9ACTO|nr:polysaccharide deacetylase family protein [Gleimia coleocanis]EEH63215.1 Tat pathway signal sequence domain protein [Gleimia coleocanis DSM 15436]
MGGTSRRRFLQLLGTGIVAGTIGGGASYWYHLKNQVPPVAKRNTPKLFTPTPAPSPAPSPVAPVSNVNAELVQQVISNHAGRVPVAFGLDLPGILQRKESSHAFLTLDLCGGPNGANLDTDLIAFLREKQVPATIFVNNRWLQANPELFMDLTADSLFLIANHGTAHAPVTVNGRDAYGIAGTADASAAAHEVADNHLALFALTGHDPQFFRSGTAHYDEVGISIVTALQEVPVGFSVNADGGATFNVEQIVLEMSTVVAGDIIIAHANQPGGSTAEGLRIGVTEALSRGVSFARLDEA